MFFSKIWTWLSQDRNNKALSSLGSIITTSGIIVLISYGVSYATNLFGSVEIVAYDDEARIVVSNNLVDDILLLDITTEASLDDGWKWTNNKPLLEVVEAKSTRKIEFPKLSLDGERQIVPFNDDWGNTIKKTTRDKCFSMLVYNEKNPQYEFLVSSHNQEGARLGTVNIAANLKYSIKGKQKELVFPAVGIILWDKNCSE